MIFDEQLLLDEAVTAAGYGDFGDDRFREPLRVLLASLAAAPLSDIGSMILRGGILKSLVTRLRTNQCFAEHPEIAHERIESPIVVVGMMRTGTTLIQRLLAADPRNYAAMGWEIGEAAPRPGTLWTEPDPRITDAEERDVQARTFFPDLVAIHPTDAHEAEEEIMFLADAFLSHVHEASADLPAYRAWLDDQDFTPAYDHLHRMLQLLQWQKCQRGDRRDRWVLKTPAHLGYLDTLFAVFPDAHVVHMHRDPLDTIPSGASLNYTLWKMHADDVDPHEVGRQWIERMAFTNRRAMAVRDQMGDDRFTDVSFRDAVDDPFGQIGRVYDAIGVEFTDDARASMHAWLDGHSREKLPRHDYTAEQFGLSNEQIRIEFAAYIDRFRDLV